MICQELTKEVLPPEIPESLWASRNLDLVWLSRNVFVVPCLLSAAPARPATRGSSEADRPDPAPLRWFWPVGPTFGAWLVRRIRRVQSEGLDWDSRERASAELIQNYLKELSLWDECKRLATAGPVQLPHPFLAESLELARFGLMPKWDGWEKQYQSAAGSEPASPPDVESPPARKSAPRKSCTRDRRSATADLF